MKERRKREKRQLNPALRLLGSLIALAVILILGNYTFRFCMGLFMTGDEYIVTLPGESSPVVARAEQPIVEDPASTEPGTIREVSRSTVTVTGDLMMHIPTINSGKTSDGYNYDYIFTYIKNYVSKADYAVVNLETTLAGTDNGNEYSGYPKFNAPDAIAASAKSAGFDMLLTANNHCNDTGTYGLKRTLEVLKAQQLDTLGTTATAEEAKYVVKDVGGIQVGMVNYSYAEIGNNRDQPTMNGLPTDASAAGLINAFDYTQLDLFYTEMENHIANMRAAGAEVIVLFIHWGEELTTKVNANQTAIAQKMCDLGVDIIAGGHPHVVQPMDLLTSTVDESHKTVCLYSMGNFLSNQRATNISLTTGHSEDSVLFSFTMVKYSDGTVAVESVDLLPTWVLIRGSGDSRKYYILPLDKSSEDWKTAFELTDSQAEDAQASYNRTMTLVSEGLSEVQSYLSDAKDAREAAIAEVNGVG